MCLGKDITTELRAFVELGHSKLDFTLQCVLKGNCHCVKTVCCNMVHQVTFDLEICLGKIIIIVLRPFIKIRYIKLCLTQKMCLGKAIVTELVR